jgi:hypothetical protein
MNIPSCSIMPTVASRISMLLTFKHTRSLVWKLISLHEKPLRSWENRWPNFIFQLILKTFFTASEVDKVSEPWYLVPRNFLGIYFFAEIFTYIFLCLIAKRVKLVSQSSWFLFYLDIKSNENESSCFSMVSFYCRISLFCTPASSVSLASVCQLFH